MESALDSGNTAWILISCALVMLMTPGLAFFYGGMVRVKSVLNMLMMSAAAMAIVTIIWVVYGYSLALTKDEGNGLIGGFDAVGLEDQIVDNGAALPESVFVAFQLMFAIITVALISGAIADRAKFSTWCIFAAVWVSIVYVPVAHWVFHFGHSVSVLASDEVTPCPADAKEGDCTDVLVDPGWIVDLGALDFAGGTAVHINAGAAALALVIVLGKRKGWGKDPMRPHNLPLVFLGAGLLWFGWFGFNAGSAVAANNTAGVAFLNTQVATAAAVIGWLIVERLRDGHFTSLGAVSGAITGLVAITPACNTVTPLGAIAIGVIAGAICAFAITLKWKLGYDDSLDVVGIHLVGGLVGTLMIGVVGAAASPAGVDGLLFGGGGDQLGKQTIAAFAVMGYSFFVTLIIAFALEKTIGFRIPVDDEVAGIDLAEHAETGYELTAVGTAQARIPGSGASHAAPAPSPRVDA
ncbi:MAG: ammonium transporter [Sporichthyaceae bacterium]